MIDKNRLYSGKDHKEVHCPICNSVNIDGIPHWLYKILESVKAKKDLYIKTYGIFNIDDCYKDCVAPNICKRLITKYNL